MTTFEIGSRVAPFDSGEETRAGRIGQIVQLREIEVKGREILLVLVHFPARTISKVKQPAENAMYLSGELYIQASLQEQLGQLTPELPPPGPCTITEAEFPPLYDTAAARLTRAVNKLAGLSWEILFQLRANNVINSVVYRELVSRVDDVRREIDTVQDGPVDENLVPTASDGPH